MRLSKEQQTISDRWATTNDNILVNACPGSGKTTLSVHLMGITNQLFSGTNQKVLAVAFNRAIASEMDARTKDLTSVMARTLHSVGFASLKRALGADRINLDGRKSFLMAKTFLDGYGYVRNGYKIREGLATLYDMWRIREFGSLEELKTKALESGAEIENRTFRYIGEFIETMSDYNNMSPNGKEMMIDFTDMIYLPKFRSDVALPKFDVVVLDEAQDASKLMQHIVNNCLKEGGRKLVVGDNFQSIYEFAGADPGSMHNFLGQPNFVDLPMNLSFRCSHAVVEAANRFNPDMVAFENTVRGSVRDGSVFEAQDGDMILCRNNAPLAAAFVALLSRGKRAQIKDSDIAKVVGKLIKPAVERGHSTGELIRTLNGRADEIKMQLVELGEQEPDTHPTYVEYVDKVEMVKTLLTLPGVTSPATLDAKMKDIFDTSDDNGITLMSMHKSKGLESDRVIIIRPDLWPSKRAKTATQFQQEDNLLFVAMTRAKKDLIWDYDFNMPGDDE